MKTNLESFMVERKSNLEQLQSDKVNCQKEIRSFRKKINSMFDKIERNASKELEKLAKRHKEKLESQLTSASDIKQSFDYEMMQLRFVLNTGDSDGNILTDMKISNRLEDLKTSTDKLLQESAIEDDIYVSCHNKK